MENNTIYIKCHFKCPHQKYCCFFVDIVCYFIVHPFLILMARLCLLGSELKMLRALKNKLLLRLTFLAFKTEHNLTSGFRLFVEDRLRLTTKTHLLRVVTSLSLSKVRRLTSLVLSNFVHGMLLAFGAKGATFFWDIDHLGIEL